MIKTVVNAYDYHFVLNHFFSFLEQYPDVIFLQAFKTLSVLQGF